MINKIRRLYLRLKRGYNKKVFIAMWMDGRNERLKTAIKEAVLRAGYKSYRIDDIRKNNQITEEIFSRIKKSPFIVVDFTYSKKDGPRGSVFYEAGFARGAGIEVVHTCKNSILNQQKLSFDTSQFRHTTWKNFTDKEMETFVDELHQHIVESRGGVFERLTPEQKKEIKAEVAPFKEAEKGE